ncbi:CLUMA_CG011289, isoform A [Clunio marinus]|uniref:Adenosine 3'-phospho 5'-phosphosulfate transporter 2 n=1 Tax=Clunio marinus TaxID=568069 RepID=A0A1J1IDS7_9DIPT|nr:CLUMA_CG011289, isoform A [Clunio marinus]
MLPTHNKEKQSPNSLKVLCFTFTHLSPKAEFLIACGLVFVFYLIYGYFAELIFTLDGVSGWYITLVQFLYYTIFGLFDNVRRERTVPIKIYLLLAFLTLGTMGLSNFSLEYLNYPMQIIFKSCKLIPVLIGSILIQKKKHNVMDFLAAFAMCIGLIFFTLADSQVSPRFSGYGVFIISLALVFDAVIGNVQELAMKKHNAPNSEVVFYSYGIGFLYLLVLMLLTGDFFSGFIFCREHPVETYGYGFLLSVTGYLGIQVVLTLVRTSGATTAVTVTTTRKAMSIAVSFIFFTKPFTMQYVWSGLIIVLGIYLNVYSKKSKLTFKDIVNKVRFIFETKRNKRSQMSDQEKLLDV